MKRREFAQSLAAAAAAAAIPGARASATSPRRAPGVNGGRLNGWLTAIGEFGKNPQGGVTRLAYSDADLAARAYTMQLMRDAGLDVTIDAAGNVFGKRAGTAAAATPVIFGSHVDAVPEGGNYDGNVGTLAAIEVVRTFGEMGVTTTHPLWVVCWQNEEGGTWGSQLVTREATAADMATVAGSGKSIADGIRLLGGDPARLSGARLRKGGVHGYLELHIEQGGNLDRDQRDIGIVEGIIGLREWDVTIDGFANHAGTTPMNERHDAMLAAARFTEMVNRIVTSEPGRQVGTVGRLQAFPGAPNVVPGKVACTLELRDLDDRKIQRLYDTIVAESRKIGDLNGTTFAYHEFVTHESAPCDARVRALIGASARSRGFSTMSLPSGAGHDAQNMARVCPMGMIFIPSVGGVSHSPREFSRPGDITNGANVLLGTVLALDAATFR
jgi:beta-ureidopropionase / N-carbamoyl-L-amino-acid hydrolase